MTVEMLLNILEVVTPFKHLKKLREFVTMKLPPGFPVKIGNVIVDQISTLVSVNDNFYHESEIMYVCLFNTFPQKFQYCLQSQLK